MTTKEKGSAAPTAKPFLPSSNGFNYVSPYGVMCNQNDTIFVVTNQPQKKFTYSSDPTSARAAG